MAVKRKNKHGRVGVKRPLGTTSDMETHLRREAYEKGYAAGRLYALERALTVAVESRTVKVARDKLRELVDASA